MLWHVCTTPRLDGKLCSQEMMRATVRGMTNLERVLKLFFETEGLNSVEKRVRSRRWRQRMVVMKLIQII